MRRGLLLLAITLVIAGVVFGLSLRLPPVQRRLGAELAALVGTAVRVDAMRLSFLPSFGVRLDGVRIVDPVRTTRSGEEIVLLEARCVRLIVPLRALLSGNLDVEALRVDEPVWNEDLTSGEFGRLLEVLADVFGADDGTEPKESADSPSPLHLPIRAVQAKIVVTTADHVALEMSIQEIEVDLRRRAAQGAGLEFNALARLGGEGLVRAVGTYEGALLPNAFELKISVEGARGDSLFAKPPGGFAVYEGAASLTGSTSTAGQRFSDALRGTGSIHFQGGTVSATSVGGLLWKTLIGVIPSAHKEASYSLAAKPTTIHSLHSSFSLADGGASTRDLKFRTDDYLVAGKGSLGFDLAIDVLLDVHLTNDGFQKLLLISKLPLPAVPVAFVPSVPVAVQGTLVDPVFVPKGQRLPLATAGYLVDSVTGIGRATIRGLEKGAEAIRR